MDLYLAIRSDAPHLLKIGRSSNALSRCRQLQTGHCFKIHVEALWVGFGARERAVHRALQDYRIENSEWFAVDWLTTAAAINAARPEEAKHASVPSKREPGGTSCAAALSNPRDTHT